MNSQAIWKKPAMYAALAVYWMCLPLTAPSADGLAVAKLQRTDQPLSKVDAARLRKTISHLQGYGNRAEWDQQWETARWIEEEIAKSGIDAVIEVYDWNSKAWPNVIARIDGEDSEAAAVLFLAHFDSTTRANDGLAPGADDNGSGVAVLLEVVRLIRDTHLDRPVVFCFFSNEERSIRGSKAFVQKSRENKFGIHCVINVDTVGYRPRGLFRGADALMGNPGFKYKLKAVYRMACNAFLALFHPHESVKVVGPEAYRHLVDRASAALERFGGLGVARHYDTGCG
jgi:hypothetical protein